MLCVRCGVVLCIPSCRVVTCGDTLCYNVVRLCVVYYDMMMYVVSVRCVVHCGVVRLYVVMLCDIVNGVELRCVMRCVA